MKCENVWDNFLGETDFELLLRENPSKCVELLFAAKHEISEWREELSKVMPEDFKDWWQNDKREWPLVARLCMEDKKV